MAVAHVGRGTGRCPALSLMVVTAGERAAEAPVVLHRMCKCGALLMSLDHGCLQDECTWTVSVPGSTSLYTPAACLPPQHLLQTPGTAAVTQPVNYCPHQSSKQMPEATSQAVSPSCVMELLCSLRVLSTPQYY